MYILRDHLELYYLRAGNSGNFGIIMYGIAIITDFCKN